MPPLKIKRNNNSLDILRWVCAFVVVLYHLRISDTFNAKYNISNFVNYPFPGSMCVLIFFILSGYVIAINNSRLSSKQEIMDYIKKRLLRIAPIYTISILLVVAAFPGQYNFPVVLSNLLYVSVPLKNVMGLNGALWSLHFELLYYFVFIFIAYFRIPLKYLVGALGAITFVLFFLSTKAYISPLLRSYVIGFLFWLTGAWLTTFKISSTRLAESKIVAIFLLVFSMFIVNPYAEIMKILHLKEVVQLPVYLYHDEISYSELFYYPIFFILMLACINAYNKKYDFVMYAFMVYSLAKYILIYRHFFAIHDLYGSSYYFLGFVFLCLSIFFWIRNNDFGARAKTFIKSSIPLSHISYAVYIIHMPFLFIFSKYSAPNIGIFAFEVLLYLAVVAYSSYLLEMKFQPFIKKLLFPAPSKR